MRTIAIKMKSYQSGVNIINNNDIERRLLKILLLLFGVLGLFYVIFLGNIVFNIVERRTIEASVRTLDNEVMNLESTYLAMSGKIDLASSYALGFKAATPSFATRKSIGFVSKDDGNEI